MTDVRLHLGMTDHVVQHMNSLYPYLNQIVGMSVQCSEMSDSERAALMFTVASYFFGAAAQARHVSQGGPEELTPSPELFRELGIALAEFHRASLDAARRARQ